MWPENRFRGLFLKFGKLRDVSFDLMPPFPSVALYRLRRHRCANFRLVPDGMIAMALRAVVFSNSQSATKAASATSAGCSTALNGDATPFMDST